MMLWSWMTPARFFGQSHTAPYWAVENLAKGGHLNYSSAQGFVARETNIDKREAL